MKDFNQFQNCILSTRPTLDALSDCNVLKRKGIKAYPSPSMVIKYNKSSIINFKYDAIIFLGGLVGDPITKKYKKISSDINETATKQVIKNASQIIEKTEIDRTIAQESTTVSLSVFSQ